MKPKTFWGENWLRLLIAFALLATMVFLGYLMTVKGTTPKEAALLAVLLTAASVLASYLITNIHADLTYNQSLRDRGVQIASSMMVLKAQIESLYEWVARKRSGLPPTMAAEIADATLEHIELTLQSFRSMTGAALKGITQVIGDALAQYDAVMEQVSRLRTEEAEGAREIQEEMTEAASAKEFALLQVRMQELAAKTEAEIARLASQSPLPIAESPPQRSASGKCPYCSAENPFKIRDRIGETKPIVCERCQRPFNVHVSSGNIILTRPQPDAPDKRMPRPEYVAEGTTTQEVAKVFLQKTNRWIDPADLVRLVALICAVHRALRSAGEPISPHQLQRSVLESGQLQALQITAITARRLFKSLYLGRLFRFADGTAPNFKSNYINDFDEAGLIRVFITSCVYHLSRGGIELRLTDAAELARLLIGGLPGAEAEFRQAILAHLPAFEGPSLQAHEAQGAAPTTEPGRGGMAALDDAKETGVH